MIPSFKTNTNEISKVSLRGAERRSNPKKDEIATPFGLAMTCKDNNWVCNNYLQLQDREIPPSLPLIKWGLGGFGRYFPNKGTRGFPRLRGEGFTLIELMVVIVILGILAGLVLPRFMGRTEEAKRTKAKLQMENLEAALKLYKLDTGTYPGTEQGLEALVQKPATGVIPKNWREGGYLEKAQVPLDPWGKPYVYLSPGVKNKEFDLKSLGADGEEGGEGENQDIDR